MRNLVATFGVLAIGLGTIWLGFGFDYIQLGGLACFDACNPFDTGPNQFWASLGAATLLAGVGAFIYLAAPRSREQA
ncbi:hypothetical protein [Devosia lacusdianchii]|jgi:hypothetical protein|uniref:hypothetical protein n=1 Tax=Devosia lacusdianchii TaxID=2917991 RepID=UPI001F06CEC0|nr:hypothetical protein [Devosia sp. JXJ CY 41]